MRLVVKDKRRDFRMAGVLTGGNFRGIRIMPCDGVDDRSMFLRAMNAVFPYAYFMRSGQIACPSSPCNNDPGALELGDRR